MHCACILFPIFSAANVANTKYYIDVPNLKFHSTFFHHHTPSTPKWKGRYLNDHLLQWSAHTHTISKIRFHVARNEFSNSPPNRTLQLYTHDNKSFAMQRTICNFKRWKKCNVKKHSTKFFILCVFSSNPPYTFLAKEIKMQKGEPNASIQNFEYANWVVFYCLQPWHYLFPYESSVRICPWLLCAPQVIEQFHFIFNIFPLAKYPCNMKLWQLEVKKESITMKRTSISQIE